ncbi:MAG TPA: phosphopantetheine-binding protein, partial [Thermoanaerobaculia bacterium]
TPETQGLAVSVRDRFGDYGLVGAMLFRFDGGALAVDTFLLSCRALGRGVEHRMLARLGEIAQQSGLSSVTLPWRPSGKNRPALEFLESCGAGRTPQPGGGILFRLPAARAAATRYEPPSIPAARESAHVPAGAPAAPAAADARPTAALLSSIATELSDAGELTAMIAAQRLSRPELDVPYAAPATDVEKRLAAMFEELLGVDRIGLHDNFFALGGHSLLAMMLINRVRDAFHVEFPVTVLFDAEFSVARAAETVARFQAAASSSDAGAGALERLIGTLPDDEVRALMADPGRLAPRKGGPEKA